MIEAKECLMGVIHVFQKIIFYLFQLFIVKKVFISYRAR